MGRSASRLTLALLVALAVATHARTLDHRFLLDDGVQIFKNRAVTHGSPLAAYFFDRDTTSSRPDYNTRIYRPLRNLAFRAVVVVAGVRPLAFAIANLALYALATGLVLLLLVRLVGDARAAAWATAIWVVAPVHVEPVAYASALGDLLSLVFELAALLVALPLLADDARPRRWRIAASAALAAASMLTKEMAITAPALLVLLVLIVRPAAWRAARTRWLIGAHALVALAYLVLRTAVVGAVGQEPVTALTLRDGLRDAPWLLLHYLWITVEPLGHAASYHVAPPGLVAWSLSVVVIAAAGVLTWRWRRTVWAGLAWFCLSLLPVLHLVPLWADLADRFALFPSVGLALALAAALPPMTRRLTVVALGATIAMYSVASFVEARPWHSDSLLWRYAVDRQPDAPLARSNLATVLMTEGRIDEAAAQLEALHALGYTRADVELKRAYVLHRLGNHDAAARAATIAVQLDPSIGVAHALAGQIALARNDLAAATRELLLARQQQPTHPATGLLGYLILSARGELPASDPRIAYLRATQALSFDDPSSASPAARSCLPRPQCAAALAIALQSRPLLLEAMAALPDGPDRDHAQEAFWSTQ